MDSPLYAALLNRTLGEVAGAWHLPSERAADRFRRFPFVRLSSEATRGRRGRPGRRVALDGSWSFFATRPKAPLSELLAWLRLLHECGEPFALGLPLTSVYLRPFLFPQVRLYAPLETASAWRALFAGRRGGLEVVVEVLRESAGVAEVEGLPVLGPAAAAVDALVAHQRYRSVTLLALADSLAHEPGLREAMGRLADERGLGGELRALRDHRGNASVTRRDARAAHERNQELRRLPPATFLDLVASREAFA